VKKISSYRVLFMYLAYVYLLVCFLRFFKRLQFSFQHTDLLCNCTFYESLDEECLANSGCTQFWILEFYGVWFYDYSSIFWNLLPASCDSSCFNVGFMPGGCESHLRIESTSLVTCGHLCLNNNACSFGTPSSWLNQPQQSSCQYIHTYFCWVPAAGWY
jgi:hypothetical protein